MPLRVLACLLLTATLLGACAPPKRIERAPVARALPPLPPLPPLGAPPVAPAPAVSRANATAPAAAAVQSRSAQDARGALDEAYRRIDEARRIVPGFEADELLAAAEEAQRAGAWDRAFSLARQASARANLAANGRYLELAQQELQRSHQFTGLSDAQLAQLRNAEAQLARGAGRSALDALKRLNAQLAGTTRPYAVKAGDSLWIISGKSEIYGNPWLWPLIWQANLHVVPDPNVVRQGQVLRVRPNPTVDEVVKAVDYAREQAGAADTTIGEVREAPAE